MDAKDWQVAADIFSKVAQVIAVGVGAWWVFRDYKLRRTDVPRLQIGLTAKIVRMGDSYYLLAAISALNPGLTKVELVQKGSVLLISQRKAGGEPAEIDPGWDIETEDPQEIFEKHIAIEPGITINEELLIPLPFSKTYVRRLRLRVVAKQKPGSDIREQWTTVRIVAMTAKEVT